MYPSFITLGVSDWALAKRGVSLAFLNNGFRLNTKFVARMLTLLKERSTQAHALRGLGQVYDSLQEYQKALGFYQQSLEIIRTLGNRQEEAKLLGNLGLVYSSLRQYPPAIDFYQQSLIIQRVIGTV